MMLTQTRSAEDVTETDIGRVKDPNVSDGTTQPIAGPLLLITIIRTEHAKPPLPGFLCETPDELCYMTGFLKSIFNGKNTDTTTQ